VPYKVFLSHSLADAAWVNRIAKDAAGVGIDVYLSEHDQRPGNMLAEKVQEAIRDSDAVVVLLTANSESSAYVQQEIGYAKALKKSVIPLVERSINKQKLAMLHGVEYIPFEFQNPEPGLAALQGYLLKSKLDKDTAQPLLALGALVETASYGENLSPIEIEILRKTPSDGRIFRMSVNTGDYLWFGSATLPPDMNKPDPALAAHYLDGLESLQRRGLVRYDGDELYVLTGRGFDLRSKLLREGSGS
jgi:TIR domain-containing protein